MARHAVAVLTEDLPPAPRTPFGESKLVCEWLLRDQTVAAGLRHTTLRLPDVIGSGETTIFDPRSHAPLAAVFAALEQGQAPGTVGGDYVHADDVARAIIAAVKRMDADEPLETVYNLGSGTAVSRAELLAAVGRAMGISVQLDGAPRPENEVPQIVASSGLAARDLDWRMRHPLDEMVATSWAAHRATSPA